MKAKLEADGERMVPEHHKGRNMYGAHLARYQAALPFVDKKIVLDIACGSGYGTKIISEKAAKVFGVDVSAEAVGYAKAHYTAKNTDYKVGDGKTIPLEDHSVDVVISYETIEHVEDHKGFLQEIKRVLKPNGQLLLSTPNEKEYPKGNHFHFYEFGHQELVKILGKYFKNVDEYFQTYWLSSTILPLSLQSAEWDQDVRTLNTRKSEADDSLYFFMVCSDAKISQEIEAMTAIGELYRPVDVQKQKQDAASARKADKNILSETQKELNAVRRELDALKSSKAWKVARSMQVMKSAVKRGRKSDKSAE